ncbi:MAG: O-antigen ligase family protein [Hyphomicrobiaceae bacterium]|nr:O-antigen ligase family protein [Hyphomicrobiaceae bacterium]MCC0024495.1 O-antigen ligase family protein [Hyphomicrobiaceae bacterium]
MSLSATSTGSTEHGASLIDAMRHLARRMLGPLVALWMFAGGFVLIEPSPYELVFIMVLPVAILAGVGLHKQPQILLYLLILFAPFGMIGAFQVTHMPTYKGVFYVLVTIFLWLTGYFAANYVADDPDRNMTRMMKAYTIVAVLVAAVGSLAYLGLIPGKDIFTRYGRAKGTFEDPNVFGPFLILPAMYALQAILLKGRKGLLRNAAILGVLAAGVFFSFSRAAWGHLLISGLLVFLFVYLFESTKKIRARMVFLILIGVGVGVVGLAAILSIGPVRDLFLQRANLVQSYDSGETGRFGRQAYAFELALNNPIGIGPLEFENLRIVEEPHDTYVKVLLTYGWMGGLAYYILVILTLHRGYSALVRQPRYRLWLIPLVAVFTFLVIESAIIDSDHWRHYFLVIGMIWGVTAYADRKQDPMRADMRAIQ